MQGFYLKTQDQAKIRFSFYLNDALQTSKSFYNLLPLTTGFYHARYSGLEIWCADAIQLDIPQENASVFTLPGEMVLGPSKPIRVKTANALGIYYGEGRGLDAANIFARVFPEDFNLLQTLGEQIWKNGQQVLHFDKLEAHD